MAERGAVLSPILRVRSWRRIKTLVVVAPRCLSYTLKFVTVCEDNLTAPRV